MFAFLNDIYTFLSDLSTRVLLYIVWGGFLVVFLLCVVLSLKVKAVKRADKRPFLCLVNCFCGLTFAACNQSLSLSASLFNAVIFWIVGYIFYGVLCAVSGKEGFVQTLPHEKLSVLESPQREDGFLPSSSVQPQKSNVRLEHALSVIENLLMRQLGKTDRQEVEKLKSTLSVLRLKGELSLAEGEYLNDSFNTLLKLMAKYNV
jgi:hypothetical protein